MVAKSSPKTDAHGDSEGPRCGGVEQGRHNSPQPPEVWVHRLLWPRGLKSGRPWGAVQEAEAWCVQECVQGT